jgi:3-deoxy-7-phosphoheptulonate synthase
MIVVMRRNAKPEEIDHMIKQVESLGLKPTVLRGTERTVIAAIGDERNAPVGILESGPGVDEVLPVLAPYKIASIETKSEPTVVRAGSLTVGGGTMGVIAGPCSVESEEQIVGSARAIKKAGATALRGGAFKPRTSPYAFQGLKEEGLRMLATARDETGLAVVTEVVAPEDVDVVCKYADVLQIGARNMQNYRLLEAVGRTKHAVLLKRGPSATVEELLLAAEYILDGGNQQVMLCERGIRTFEARTSTRKPTCPSSSTPATAPATRRSSPPWPAPPSPLARTALSSRSIRTQKKPSATATSR